VVDHNAAETVADLVRKSIKPEIVTARDGREFVVGPPGMSTMEIKDEYGLKHSPPSYLDQRVTLQSVESLIDYVNRFKTDDTMLFANIEHNAIVGVLDYHGKTVDSDEPPHAVVQLACHRGRLELPFSEEWQTWTAINGTMMKQLEFARFIEENAVDITAPEGAALLEIVRDIQALRRVNFIQAVRTSNDSENFEYKVESDARSGEIEIPTKFKLSLPVYFDEPPQELYAFLRWRIDENAALTLGVKLHRLEHVRQAVFKQIVLMVADKTSRPVVFGELGDGVSK